MPATKNSPHFAHNVKRFVISALAIVSLVAVIPAAAQDDKPSPIKVAQLAGQWQATLTTFSPACGTGTELLTFTLDSTGMAMDAAFTGYSQMCGTQNGTMGMIMIMFLNGQGTGVAMTMLGMDMAVVNIQVSKNRQVFNLVDTNSASMVGSAVQLTRP